MPERSAHSFHATENCVSNFVRVDQIFNILGFSEGDKIAIFQILASILHLGNVLFGDTNNGYAQINESFEKNVEFASKLLNIPFDELKTALLFKSINDNKIEIK